MIVDVFPFNEEFDHLKCRMYELDGLADRHIAIEADQTFTGKPKPYRLSRQAWRYPKLEVVRVHIGDDHPTETWHKPWMTPETARFWWKERIQRGGASWLLSALPDDTVFLFGDVDEIPRRSTIESFDGAASVLVMAHLVYSVRNRLDPWAGTVIGRKSDIGSDFHSIRENRWHYRSVGEAGWHLSWFGGPEKRERKFSNSCHQELGVAGRLTEELPAKGLHVDGQTPLQPYEGDLPRWVVDGHAPSTWMSR